MAAEASRVLGGGTQPAAVASRPGAEIKDWEKRAREALSEWEKALDGAAENALVAPLPGLRDNPRFKQLTAQLKIEGLPLYRISSIVCSVGLLVEKHIRQRKIVEKLERTFELSEPYIRRLVSIITDSGERMVRQMAAGILRKKKKIVEPWLGYADRNAEIKDKGYLALLLTESVLPEPSATHMIALANQITNELLYHRACHRILRTLLPKNGTTTEETIRGAYHWLERLHPLVSNRRYPHKPHKVVYEYIWASRERAREDPTYMMRMCHLLEVASTIGEEDPDHEILELIINDTEVEDLSLRKQLANLIGDSTRRSTAYQIILCDSFDAHESQMSDLLIKHALNGEGVQQEALDLAEAFMREIASCEDLSGLSSPMMIRFALDLIALFGPQETLQKISPFLEPIDNAQIKAEMTTQLTHLQKPMFLWGKIKQFVLAGDRPDPDTLLPSYVRLILLAKHIEDFSLKQDLEQWIFHYQTQINEHHAKS